MILLDALDFIKDYSEQAKDLVNQITSPNSSETQSVSQLESDTNYRAPVHHTKAPKTPLENTEYRNQRHFIFYILLNTM